MKFVTVDKKTHNRTRFKLVKHVFHVGNVVNIYMILNKILIYN